MALTIKDISGVEHEVASKGMTTAALTTGIIGTAGVALAALNGGNGLFGGILGGNNGANGAALATTAMLAADGAACCFVNKDMFYQTLIAQINGQAERDLATERRLSTIESAVATGAAVGECNSAAIAREFQVMNDRFTVENIINEKNLALSLCNVVRGQTYLSPSSLADSFISPTRVIDSHEAREYLPGRYPFQHGGGCAPCGAQF